MTNPKNKGHARSLPKRGYRPELAVLKGIMEKSSAGAYFGSWLALGHWRKEAEKAGWIKCDVMPIGCNDICDVVTPAGHAVYKKLKLAELPTSGRAYMWRWPA